MGGFSLWHWLVVLLIVAVPILAIALTVWLVVRLTKVSRPTSHADGNPPALAPSPARAEQRLQELTSLRAKGLISDAEYEDRRNAVLSDI